MLNKKRSKSSKIWLRRNFKDKFVIEAKKKNLRSRSWFKLDEIQKKEKIFYPGLKVLDLGSSPGGWSKYAINCLGKKGLVIACDILPMKNIKNVEFIQGNIKDKFFFKTLINRCNLEKISVVMSDMSPNISGIPTIDIPNSIKLLNLSLMICLKIITSKGIFLSKVFQGKNLDIFLKKIKLIFKTVKILNLNSSRFNSRELYIIAKKNL